MKVNKIFLSVFIIAMTTNHFAQESVTDKYNNLFFKLDFEKDSVSFDRLTEFFFTTFPHNDPTAGDVVYDRTKWQNDEMLKLAENDALYGYVKFRKDSSAFDSFRLTSKPYYNLNENNERILFVFKGELPSSKGLWPAWWLNGSREDEWLYKKGEKALTDEYVDTFSGKGEFYNTSSPVNCTDWPSAGEVDIIETINGENIFYNTIHTCPNMCDSEWNGSGQIINCANAQPDDPNKGCTGAPYQLEEPKGTFACLWEKSRITFYYWSPEEKVRADGGPLSENPEVDSWESNIKNRVRFLETDTVCEDSLHYDWQCNICEDKDSCSFVNLKMVFNVTLCGKWAGYEFDDTENSNKNCSGYILGEGAESINNKYMKIEYVSVQKINNSKNEEK